MSQSRFRQDMPPPGGFGTININRLLPRNVFKSPVLLGGFVIWSAYFLLDLRRGRKALVRYGIERNDTDLAMQPFLLAERDRAYLKQLRKNRDEEAMLMKDVEGWEVGTLYGEKLFKTAPPDYHFDPVIEEYFCHTDPYHTDYQTLYGAMQSLYFVAYKYNPKDYEEKK